MQTDTSVTVRSFVHSAYSVLDWKHAEVLLSYQFSQAYVDVLNVLFQFRLYRSDILAEGGSRSPMSKGIETPLTYLGWEKRTFDIQLFVNEKPHLSYQRRIDHYKDGVALEVEWNSKEEFFDRDLEKFRLLYQLNLISAGIIITRGDSLQHLFKELRKSHKLKGTKFGTTTTQMGKLEQKIHAGGGAGCPILVFGITEALYIDQKEGA
ncbi:hypothetical protein KDA_30460 [Dictyobacter alpinus]|uniref:Restriction endonuclease n=1 Tax=Dictyobacter alpinus TaxID=2014873 RepID=A0A402B8C4_9CHLR|nr:BglII/BstYI family type II restriction endonuclease [Dictyobacter alpinus]GCE27562.1 hypothetical protein KDA_30460 [Dictyobacter alpinus]